MSRNQQEGPAPAVHSTEGEPRTEGSPTEKGTCLAIPSAQGEDAMAMLLAENPVARPSTSSAVLSPIVAYDKFDVSPFKDHYRVSPTLALNKKVPKTKLKVPSATSGTAYVTRETTKQKEKQRNRQSRRTAKEKEKIILQVTLLSKRKGQKENFSSKKLRAKMKL